MGRDDTEKNDQNTEERASGAGEALDDLDSPDDPAGGRRLFASSYDDEEEEELQM